MDWEYKIIRDPLYGYIGLTEREVALIDTYPLQRLRRIKQLAMTELVYPGAVHSRFEHTLGVLFVADRMAQRLNFDERNREIIRAAALLHDVGHGPFSHVFENILRTVNEDKVTHEQITVSIIESREISEVLSDIKEDVLDIFAGEEKTSVLRDIISSSLDADKLDYLRRDSYHTGVAYGLYDFERVIYMLDIDDKHIHLVVKEKGKDALESFRLARYLMHVQVYQHHVRAISDAMLTRAAELAFEEGSLDSSKFVYSKSKNFLSHFLSYDDFLFLYEITSCSEGNAKRLVEMLRKRKLLKRGYEKDMSDIQYYQRRRIDGMEKAEFREMEKTIAQKAGIEPDFVIVYPIRIENPVYSDPDKYLRRKEIPILIKLKSGEIVPFDDISPISGAPQKYVRKFFVFCPEGKRQEVHRVVEEVIGNL